MTELLGLREADIWLATTSLTFDPALLEWMSPLTTGGCIGMVAPEESRDPRAVLAAAGRWKATVIQGTPTFYRTLLQAGSLPAGIRLVLCGGEVMSADLGNALTGPSSREVWNLYGPTEGTIWSTAYRLKAIPYRNSPPIGKPIMNVDVHILDSDLSPVADGVAGEICISGAGVALGYVGTGGLSENAFVKGQGDGMGRLYRTGDIGRRNPENDIEFLGRQDDQVKIRGVRIEPGEIEAAILRIDGVARAAVVTTPDLAGDHFLVAFLAFLPGASVELALLRTRLSEVLPGPLIPSRFIRVSELPLTSSGKIDRRKLLASISVSPDKSHGAEEERILTAIWSQAFGGIAIQPDDDFFELGGHSLNALLIALRSSEAFDVTLSPVDIFAAGSIRQLASCVRARQER